MKSHQAKTPLPVGLPFPLSYNHLLFKGTLAFPLATPVELLPRLLSKGEDARAAAAPPIAFCIRGLAEKGLPEAPLLTPSVLASKDEGLPLRDEGEPDEAF